MFFLFPVVSQFFESQVSDEYVIKGNAAVLKCNIPSFVSDHVEIIEWVDSSGVQYDRNNAGIDIDKKKLNYLPISSINPNI